MRNIVRLMHRTLAIAAAAALILLLPAAGWTEQPGAHVGTLICQMAPKMGLTERPAQTINCRFLPDEGDLQQAYEGEIDTVGPDVGIATGGVLAWDVSAPGGVSPAGGVAGVYVVTDSDISRGAGVGAHMLVGGSNGATALQPLALEGEIEVTLGLGVSSMKLVDGI
jgi:hypothetical protein